MITCITISITSKEPKITISRPNSNKTYQPSLSSRARLMKAIGNSDLYFHKINNATWEYKTK